MFAGMPTISPWLPLVAVAIVSFLALLCLTVYNVFFHPLRNFPGPWYTGASISWWQYQTFRGNLSFKIKELHNQYGDVVRIAPNELSFTHPQAWKGIYGHCQGQPENAKDPAQIVHEFTEGCNPSIIEADQQRHVLLRRLMSKAFADKSLKEQEPVLLHYIDLLIQRLVQKCEEGRAALNAVDWYNFTTFDIIGHLTFGESFDCLQNSNHHPWVAQISSIIKIATLIRALNRFVLGTASLLIKMLPPSVKEARADDLRKTYEKVLRRKERTPLYTDFMTHLLEAVEKGVLQSADLTMNAEVLVVAGGDTTSTLLSGATYFLLRDLRIYEELRREVRSSFPTSADITLQTIKQLKYTLAFLDESLRMYPPVPNALIRQTPPTGTIIDGQFVPGNTTIGISHYAAFRCISNFKDPESFIPERWLGDPKFEDDRRDVVQPFSYGPRNCIGRNLGYMEVRLIMAKLLWHFDMELMPESAAWIDHKIFTIWEKRPLWVRLTPVQRNHEKGQ